MRITRTRAPRGLPVDCVIEGVLLAEVEVGKPVHLAPMERNGELVDGVSGSSPVASVLQNGFATASAAYRVDLLGEPGAFSVLVEVLLRELKPHDAREM